VVQLFHEAGHVLLHGRRVATLTTTRGVVIRHPHEESEANLFASDFLIPPINTGTSLRRTATARPSSRHSRGGLELRQESSSVASSTTAKYPGIHLQVDSGVLLGGLSRSTKLE